MSYINDLLHYIMLTVEIVDGVVHNKQPEYSFLTDSIIIKLKNKPKNLKLIDDEINAILNIRSYNDAIETIKERYSSEMVIEKRDLILSIMKRYFKEQEYISESDEEQGDYPPFNWKDNQDVAINETMSNTFENKFVVPFSGIHCQATGAGKTFIGLNIIARTCEINNYAGEMTIIWFTERKSILMNNFYKKDLNGNIEQNKENYGKWRAWNIIDISKFKLYQFVENKDGKWYDKINKPSNKPKLIIINRTFLANKEKYKKIKKNLPCLIIHDECHSATNETSYKFLTFAKNNWNSSIIGFSATPIRINNKNNYKDEDYDKLTEIFMFNGKINIISNYNINEAIANKVIVPPKFKWYKLKNKSVDDKYMKLNGNDTEILKHNFLMAMKELNRCYPELIFKKTVAWTGTIDQANDWKQLFKKHKKDKREDGQWKYENLYKIKSYVDHSLNDDDEYLEFEKRKGKCILFCVGKHREGSDIQYLDSCIFLDCVKKRSSHVFIQCIGRVLRLLEGKKHGLVIDGFVRENNYLHEKIIIDKIIGYYLIFQNMELLFEDKVKKIEQYSRIKNDIIFDNENQIIKIKINDNDCVDVECGELEWSTIGNVFSEVLKKKLNFDLKDEFIQLMNDVAECGFVDKDEYKKAAQKLNDLPENPEIKYSKYWSNLEYGWYTFLGIDTDGFIKSVGELKKYCKKYGVTNSEDYNKLCKKKKKLPCMPEELYKGFTNVKQEIGFYNSAIL